MAATCSAPDYYQALQLDPGAEPEIISLVYRQLAKKFHPDVAPSGMKGEYEERMKLVNEAHATLADPDRRRSYDAARPGSSGSGSYYLVQFEAAAVLAEAAAAGGGATECYGRSAEILNHIIEEAEGTPIAYEARVRLADIQYNGLQQYGPAADTLEKLVQSTPKGVERDQMLLVIADCHVKRGTWPVALEAYDRVISECLLPDTMQAARLNRADVLDNLQKYQEAVEAFELCARTYAGMDGGVYAQYRLARVLDTGLERFADALAAYRSVLRDYPSSKWAQDCQWRIDWIQRKHIEKKAWWE